MPLAWIPNASVDSAIDRRAVTYRTDIGAHTGIQWYVSPTLAHFSLRSSAYNQRGLSAYLHLDTTPPGMALCPPCLQVEHPVTEMVTGLVSLAAEGVSSLCLATDVDCTRRGPWLDYRSAGASWLRQMSLPLLYSYTGASADVHRLSLRERNQYDTRVSSIKAAGRRSEAAVHIDFHVEPTIAEALS